MSDAVRQESVVPGRGRRHLTAVTELPPSGGLDAALDEVLVIETDLDSEQVRAAVIAALDDFNVRAEARASLVGALRAKLRISVSLGEEFGFTSVIWLSPSRKGSRLLYHVESASSDVEAPILVDAMWELQRAVTYCVADIGSSMQVELTHGA